MSTAIRDAPVPFSGAPDPDDSNPVPDFILRSSDGVDFHVHKQILAFVSIQRDGKDVLAFPESSDVLFRLLSVAYPARSREQYSFTPADLDSVCAVHEAAQKYQFVQAQKIITEMLLDPSLLKASPHRLFAIALLRHLPELAEQAALSTLDQPLGPADLAFPDMARITWDKVQRLFDFHHQCGSAAEKIVRTTRGPAGESLIGHDGDPDFVSWNMEAWEAFPWWEERHHGICDPIDHRDCDPAYGHDTLCTPNWFFDHITRVAGAIRLVPSPITLDAEVLDILPAQADIVDSCDICGPSLDRNLRQFAAQLAPVIIQSNKTIAAATNFL
ncbi:hypothetical protein C8R46DRAFT_1125572 [Mycena filopes]|nr:hypothetical protein C8R46DRAFT_1125572 [Mycena filopes]